MMMTAVSSSPRGPHPDLSSAPPFAARAYVAGSNPVGGDPNNTNGAADDLGPLTLDFKKLVEAGERPLDAYDRLASMGTLREDEAQRAAIQVLDDLHGKLIASSSSSSSAAAPELPAASKAGDGGGWFSSLFGGGGGDGGGAGGGLTNDAAARVGHGGVYMYGGPGCGKTFCMDLAYACLPGKEGVHKRREHFHSFMLATHHALHKLGKAGGDAAARDTVALHAADIARHCAVLCLDEFQVTDVADAMIIRRLLDQLWARGVTLVTTSNRVPDELYKNGLNRVQFVPCIEAIKARCVVHPMKSERDYRLTGTAVGSGVESGPTGDGSSSQPCPTWKSVADPDAGEAWLAGRLRRLANVPGGGEMVPVEVALGGRRIRVSKAGGGVAQLDFDEVCASALGAADYTALAAVFHTIGEEETTEETAAPSCHRLARRDALDSSPLRNLRA